jgi:hypothetical protein
MDQSPARVHSGRQLGEAGKLEGLVLGSLALLPLVLAAILVWLTPPATAGLIIAAATIWSGALLAFLAGVRRGLTFSEAATPRTREIVSMLWLFGVAVVALWLAPGRAALEIAMIGFVSVAVLDFRAARQAEAPRYFAVFRPLQAVVALASLAILFAAIA